MPALQLRVQLVTQNRREDDFWLQRQEEGAVLQLQIACENAHLRSTYRNKKFSAELEVVTSQDIGQLVERQRHCVRKDLYLFHPEKNSPIHQELSFPSVGTFLVEIRVSLNHRYVRHVLTASQEVRFRVS